jgi:hypothetical protein
MEILNGLFSSLLLLSLSLSLSPSHSLSFSVGLSAERERGFKRLQWGFPFFPPSWTLHFFQKCHWRRTNEASFSRSLPPNGGGRTVALQPE